MRLIDADTLKGVFVGEYPGMYTKKYIKNLIDGMPTVEMPGWISVKERMPDLDEQVLIVYEWTGRSRAKYREIALDSFKAMRFLGYTPLFWMPIPELPEEVSGDGT